MIIPSIKQIRNLDAYTIENEPIASVDLMERAAKACTDWIIQRFSKEIEFSVVCGNGNNGGDGFAIARLLTEAGFTITTFFHPSKNVQSADCRANYERLMAISSSKIIEIDDESSVKFKPNTIIIDALFGSGLNKKPEGIYAAVIQAINDANTVVISIDMPSGLNADAVSEHVDAIVKSTFTLSFEYPKLAFFMPENEKFVGEWTILPIKLLSDYFINELTPYNFTLLADIQPILQNREKFSHKGIFGKALLIAGKYGMAGAAVLASKACLKSGVGLLHVHIPKSIVEIIQITTPEAIISIDHEADVFLSIPLHNSEQYNAIAVGPGIGTDEKTAIGLKLLIQNYRKPIIFDADAINILSENKTWLEFIPKYSIFTPHVKEFDRLTQHHDDSFSRLNSLKQFAIKYQCVCVLKGAHTAIAFPNGEIHFNSSGNSGLATGGSGDVLTGIILALLAQSYNPEKAAVLGVYIHGLAADMAIENNESPESLLPSDVITFLGKSFNFIRNKCD